MILLGMSGCDKAWGGDDAQFVAVPDDGSYSPLHRVSALVAEIAQERVGPALALFQGGLWVALGDFDAASVPLEHGARGGDGQPIVDEGFCGLSPPGLVSGIVESGRKIRLGGDDDVDTFAERVSICALFVDGWGDEGGICFRVSFGYWVKVVVAPGFFGIVVAFGFVSGLVVVRDGVECIPGADAGRWLVVGIYISPERTHGRGGISGASPSEYEGGTAARSAGCPAVDDGVLLDGGGSGAVLVLL